MNEKIKQLQNTAGIQVVRTLMRGDENTEVKLMLTQTQLDRFAELLFNEIANTAVVSDGMFNGNERHLSVELRLGDMVKKISVFGVEE